MRFFSKREGLGGESGSNDAVERWENMDVRGERKTAEQLDAERQQRKIVAALMPGRGEVDVSVIGESDVALPNGAREAVLDMIASGEIGEKEERYFIGRIQDPVRRDGAESVFDELRSKHELRILGVMVGGREGFDNWQNLGAGSVGGFVRRFPQPMDFEAVAEGFLDDIERNNDAEKRAEYERAMESFKLKLYGKKYEYWKQMKALNWAAEERKISRGTMERTVGVQSELEQSSEWVPGEVGAMKLSKAQVRGSLANLQDMGEGIWADESCEDSELVRSDTMLFGVFDGAGGVQGGREASQTASEIVSRMSDRMPVESGKDLAWLMNMANMAVEESPNAGVTTGVVVKVLERDGRKQLAYASVGDSRIYIVDQQGRARLITEDEGEGNVISNALGMRKVSGRTMRVEQFGEVELESGDRVVLCSDGITGDYGDDLMSEEELGGIVGRSRNASDAARNLVAGARKYDDRTALVFEA